MDGASVSPEPENQASKVSLSPKTSGSRKLSIAHSSCRSFCSGVPVISSRKCVANMRTTRESTDCSFLMRWASSMIR